MTDQFLYLEEIYGSDALAWVALENKITEEILVKSENFNHINQKINNVIFNQEKIPYVTKQGAYFYNLWQDDQHPKGIWRRTSFEKYCLDDIEWETVIDIDVLGAIENINWFYQDCIFLAESEEHCLIYLAEDGTDAVQVREFNLKTKQFVLDGFFVDIANTTVNWIDKNHIYVMTDFGQDSLTLSGYPRIVKKWQRGTSIEQAIIVFEGKQTDLNVFATYDTTKNFEKSILYRAINFYETEVYLLDDLKRLDLPLDAQIDFHENWLIVVLSTDWDIHPEYLAGSLLVIDLNEFLSGCRLFKIIFQQAYDQILFSFNFSKDFLILKIMKDISHFLHILDCRSDFKYVDAMWPDQQYAQIRIDHVDRTSNHFFMIEESFVSAQRLYRVDLNTRTKQLIKFESNQLIPDNYEVTQNFAISQDGTKIPYFQIAKKDLTDVPQQTLIEGYGGFQFSLLPKFLETEIPAWIDEGGIYVIANIRGGSEYGPSWHQQALKQNRQRAYEDFAAVAEELIQRGITSPNKLAAIGGSNGGLLVGNMLTQYPHLFAAIVCEVPLLDMLRFHEIGAGHLWIAEYGDPNNEVGRNFLHTISPYHQLSAAQDYPAILFYTITSDDRVSPAHARKMAAKMKELNIPEVYFYELSEGGHRIFATKKLRAFHAALVSSFLFKVLAQP
ncbi:prolyl oligopeptidase family serine peptidase [Acinetobacter sp. ANC 4558]|uniref:prolyl oligopeptidase family serine peptidase n=1 Tax=Acinetobacter sp. ANC 4558 TaxID=1977876 RepID=UPI00148A82B0|nr:prolyl oligopeptidase family serine peptidase [Acinetobacter sp. ANC 4558]